MNKEDFYKYLDEDKELNDDSLLQLKQMTEKYPYFQTAKLLLLKNMMDKSQDDDSFIVSLSSFAIECGDRERVFYYLHNKRFARFFPKSKADDVIQDDRTELLLNSFLDSLDEEKDKNYGIQSLEMDSIASTDYLAYLEQIEHEENNSEVVDETKPMKHQQLVDSFLEKSQSDNSLFSPTKKQDFTPQDSTQEVDNLLDDDTFLTETLAQVYIKQKKYEQALTIIKRLSLNFPKKSIYFADQIRFLEYLIFNDRNKKQK